MALNVYSSAVGVGITEIDKSLTLQHNSKSSAFFAGYFKKGPCNSLTIINTLQEFYNTFGEKDKSNHNDWMQVYNYLQYAGNINVSRSVGSDSINSVAEFPINENITNYLIHNSNEFDNMRDDVKLRLGNQLKFFAKDPGNWGNDISIMMINKKDFDANTSFIFGTYKPQSIFRDIQEGETGLIVLYKGQPVEIFNISFDEENSNFIEKVNYISKYIFVVFVKSTGTIDGYYRHFDGIELVTDLNTGLISIKAVFEENTSFNLSQITSLGGQFLNLVQISPNQYSLDFRPSVSTMLELDIILNESLPNVTLTSNVYFDGNKDLRDHPSYSDLTKDIEFSFFGENAIYLSGGVLAEPNITDLEQSYDVAANKEVEIDYIIANERVPVYVKNIADSRKDVIAFIGTPKFEGTIEEIYDQNINFRLNTFGNSDYCFLIMNYKKNYNNVSKKYEYCNLAGDVCGLRVKTDKEFNRWTSSAGEERGKLIGGDLQYYPTRSFIDDMYLKGINSFNRSPNGSIFLFGNRVTILKNSALDRLTTRNLSNYMVKELEKASRYFIFELIDNFLVSKIKNNLNRFLQYVKNDRGLIDFSVSVSHDKANNKLIIDVIFSPSYVTDFIQINFINTGTSALTTVK
jgi:hypothetical protein